MAEDSERDRQKFGPKILLRTVKEELFKWICERHAMNSLPDRNLLREKALRLTESRGLNGFKCSSTWLAQFLKEHGFSGNPGNQWGPVFRDYRNWIDIMRSTITKYKYRDMFHADELTMYLDAVPSNVPSSRNQCTYASESSKNRITILLACNSSGTTKLPLLICGPYLPRTTVKEHNFYHDENACIGVDLFRNWLEKLNDHMAGCNRKILLFLRRNRAHALQDFVGSHVQLLFLPKNFPPLLRPLRRDVFHYVKMGFRQRCAERTKGCNSEWNASDILSRAIESWEKIPRELIIHSFQRTHFRTDDCFLQIDCDRWDYRETGVSFKRFVTFDDDLSDEPMTHYAGYVRRPHDRNTNCRDFIEIDEDSLDSARVDVENVGDAGSKSLPAESERDSRTMSSERKGHTDKKLDRPMVTVQDGMPNDEDRIATPNDGNREQPMSQTRTYSETQFSTKSVRGDNRSLSRDDIARNIVAPKTRALSPPRTGKGKVRKEKTYRRIKSKANDMRQYLQTIVYRASTLTSTTEPADLKRLIDKVRLTDSGDRSARPIPQSRHFIERKVSKSDCASSEGTQSIDADNIKGGANKIHSNSGSSSSAKLNQPTTSANNRNPLSKESGRSTFKETIQGPHSEMGPSESELCEENQNQSQSPVRFAYLNEEDNSVPVHKEVLKFSGKKRYKSSDTNDSENDSDNGEPRGKKEKVEHNWTEQFETTFVFGSKNASLIQTDRSIEDSRIFNRRQIASPRD